MSLTWDGEAHYHIKADNNNVYIYVWACMHAYITQNEKRKCMHAHADTDMHVGVRGNKYTATYNYIIM